ncbi:hypothetical protein JCM33374_g6404 [Metschnikowia sp. JCM 33374]|nr:hypothetical protein JCM33374_g6404 [Metschnikowia sp. JCM 33374]
MLQRANSVSKITIRSSPFSFTNCNFFADFKSTGHINMVLGDSERHWGYLSDVKYLENMIGGVAIDTSAYSIGLVMGNLRKLNGDGDLIAVLPWERIFGNSSFYRTIYNQNYDYRTLIIGSGVKMQTFESKIEPDIPQPPQLENLSNLAVFPIVFMNQGQRTSWGSCVLMNPHCLITNTHVVKAYQDSDHTGCEIFTGGGSSIFLSDSDKIVSPFENLDLAFIILSCSNQLHFSSINPICFSDLEDVSVEAPVFSIGYGLFLSKTPNPLVSKGHLSSKLNLIPFQNIGKHSSVQKKMPCMLITSSACWNGSSGGGLFTHDGHFLGLICCNAEVRKPSMFDDKIRRVEKIPSICFCIPAKLILECYRWKVDENLDGLALSDAVIKAWRLESYYKDVSEVKTKL